MWNTIGGMVAMIRGQARANVDLATSCSPLGGNNNNSPPAEQYYEDTFNDEPWTCSFGTEENASYHTLKKNDCMLLVVPVLTHIILPYFYV